MTLKPCLKFSKCLNQLLISACLLTTAGTCQAMKYHDNHVTFEPQYDQVTVKTGTIKSATFTTEEFKVTDKQDPKDNIYKGLVTKLIDKKFTFKIGRSGSGKTGDWFNEKIASNQNTFNHGAGSLNFSLIGTLALDFHAPSLGVIDGPYTFADIALAQGKSGASNNWWFGGKNCEYLSYNDVSCKGVSNSGGNVEFLFHRGGGGSANVSRVTVRPITYIDTANWMGAIDGSKKLNSLMMPGSHDAGMSELHHCDIGSSLTEGLVRTQSLNMGKQLEAGSRYFDIRVDYDHGKLVTYHRTKSMGCNGQDLEVILDQIVAFLKQHSGETLILRYSHIRDNRGEQDEIKNKLDQLLSQPKFEAFLYSNSNSDTNLATVSLDNARGTMISTFNYNEYLDTSAGRFRYRNGFKKEDDGKIEVCAFRGLNLTVCDSYTGTPNYNKMKKDQLAKWDSAAALNEDYLFLLSWTLTPNVGTFFSKSTIKKLAQEANTLLPDVLLQQIVVEGKNKPNIVYIDFINKKTTQAIIQFNFLP